MVTFPNPKAQEAQIMIRFLAGALALVISLPLTLAHAQGAEKPLLTIMVDAEKRAMDWDSLTALPATSFETETIWTEGVQSFTGVSLHALMTAMDITEGTLRLTALNDYAVEVPVSDAIEGGPMIAYLHNGAEMAVRDKGPLWLVYPYDADPAYQSEVIHSRSIWQLTRIEITD